MISEAIHTKNYLNQPLTVVKQVMTGTFADGLGQVRREPDRIHFAPLPAQSMAVWILSQMKRWGYVDKNINYNDIAKEVYLSTDAINIMAEMGEKPQFEHGSYNIMDKTFNPQDPSGYVDSFPIKRS